MEYSEKWDIELNRMLDQGNYTGTIIDNKLYYVESENYQVWVQNRQHSSGYIYDFKVGEIDNEWRKKRPSPETLEKLFIAADELELKLKDALDAQ